VIEQFRKHAGSLTVLLVLVLILYWGTRQTRLVPNWLD
jgi:hypothetical protein